jgi:outer membrane receptor protein involved in Fe transport
LRLWQGGEIIAGSDFDFTRIRNLDHNEVNPSVRTSFPDMFLISPYITASHVFGSAEGIHAAPQAGVRGYIHNIWKAAAAPQAGFLAGYKNTDVYANFALGYVYPAPANIQNLVNQNAVEKSDLQSVEPEYAYHYEGGISHKFTGLASLGASVFYDDGRNRIIANDIVPKNASVISYFRILGTEFFANVSPIRDLNFFAGGTWIVRIQARGDDGVVVGKLPFTPALSFSAGAYWKLSCFNIPYIKNISISGDYRYLAGVYAANTLQFNAGFKNSSETTKLDDQHILRLRLAYQFGYKNWHIHKIETFINVDNVLNQRYEYWPGYRMPGITVTGGVRIIMN